MNKLLLLLALVPVIGLAQEVHPCTEQPLPLQGEEQLLDVILCEWPNARVLRFGPVENDNGEQLFEARLLTKEQVRELVYRLEDGKLLEEE